MEHNQLVKQLRLCFSQKLQILDFPFNGVLHRQADGRPGKHRQVCKPAWAPACNPLWEPACILLWEHSHTSPQGPWEKINMKSMICK